ncbi:MAG: hypothetical protein ACREQO_11245, partial [Candidatus Binatia bacterium]
MNYLAKTTGYNATGAISAGAKQADVLNYMAKLPTKTAPSAPTNTSLFKPNDPEGAVLNAVTTSEQNAGKDISATIAENLPSVKFAQGQAQASNQQLGQVFQRVLEKRHQLALAGKDTSQLDSILQEDAKTLGVTNLNELLPTAAKKSTGQILGDFGGVALDAATAGTLEKAATSWKLLDAAEKTRLASMGVTDAVKATTVAQKLGLVAKNTAIKSLAGGAVGYGYDVSQNLQQGKTGASAFAPGAGTAIGAALPAAFGLFDAGKIAASEFASRIDNSLIKPLPKQFRYGANPGRTMADLGITGNSFDDLETNVRKAKSDIGSQLNDVASQLHDKAQGTTIDLTQQLAPINDAMQKAASNNDQGVLNRLQSAKRAILEDLGVKIDKEGTPVIVSNGPRDLQNATFADAIDVKRKIGDLTKFTGNVSDDKTVNLALKQVYGRVNAATKSLAGTVDSELASKFDALNKKYADLQTAQIAIQHRA